MCEIEDYIFNIDGKMYVLPKRSIEFNTSIDMPPAEKIIIIPMVIESDKFMEVLYYSPPNQITVQVENSVDGWNGWIQTQFWDFRMKDDFRDEVELIPGSLKTKQEYIQENRENKLDNIL